MISIYLSTHTHSLSRSRSLSLSLSLSLARSLSLSHTHTIDNGSRGSLRSERLTSGTAPAFHNMHVLHTAVPCFSVAATSSVAEECSTAHAHSRAYAHQHTHVFLLHSSAPALVFGR